VTTQNRPGRTAQRDALRIDHGSASKRTETVATEEPLELRIAAGGASKRLGVTMRTPGNDFELAAGYVFTEGAVRSRDAVDEITYCLDDDVSEEQEYNVVSIRLRGSRLPEIPGLERHVVTSSACGVCGRESIDALLERCEALHGVQFAVPATLVTSLPQAMRESQRIFEATGGLHAAALFRTDGSLLVVREDVGRHNALDKAIGWALMQVLVPLHSAIAVVSGRASFELVQKCAAAGIAMLCSVSAPSSLAVDLAERTGVTLAGFVREGRCTVYTHPERIVAET